MKTETSIGTTHLEDTPIVIRKDKAQEIALVTAVIINEELLRGSLFQTFDKAYEIAEKFVDKYGYGEKTEQEWGVDAEFDETVIEFTNQEIEKS